MTPSNCREDMNYDRYRLSDEQVAAYRERGTIHGIKILEEPELERLRDGLHRMVTGQVDMSKLIGGFKPCENPEEANEFIYFQGGWLVDDAFRELIFNPRITVPVAQLLDVRQVRFLHDQCFYKPAKHGKNVSWHQDYSYWTRTSPSHHVSVWLPLDDASEENGTLQIIPGSQNWPLLPTVELQGGDMEALKSHLTPEQREMFKPEPIVLPAGYAEMHSDHLVHGSMPNNSDRPRRALIINYMAADTVSNDDSRPIMPGFPIVPKGEVIEGDGFPIVLDLN